MSVFRRRTSLKKAALAVATFVCLVAGINQADAALVVHYWDMDSVDGSGVPQDTAGGVATSAEDLPNLLLDSATYGEAYSGSGNALRTVLGGATSSHLLADVYDGSSATAMDFGASDFSFSYWSYDDNTDSDAFRPSVFDSLSGTSEGLQMGSTGAGVMNFRMDDDAGGAVVSSGNPPNYLVTQPADAWTHVAVNVSRTSDLVEVFFNGASQGTYDISALGGNIVPSQDLMIGARNGANNAATAQASALDDLAFYTGLLSSQDISGLASGTITPAQVPEPNMLFLLVMGGIGLLASRSR